MPHVPDASSVTTFLRVGATSIADPEKKSRTFVAALKQGYLTSTVRANKVTPPSRSVLSTPQWKSPRFNGRFFLI